MNHSLNLLIDRDQESEAKYTRICERISHLCQHFIYYKAKLENVKKEKQPLVWNILV